MTNETEFYVYLHLRKSDGLVFYVGKGCGDRAYDRADRSAYWKRIEKKHGRTIEFAATGLREWYAFEREAELIAYYGRRDLGHGQLCNMTDGGDGKSGQIMSDSAKAKVSAARMGNTAFLGRRHSEETRAKMRKPRSTETRAKMRKPKSAEMRLKLSESKKIAVACSNGMIFDSGYAAAVWLRNHGKPKAASSAITLAISGKLKTAYGFTWSHA